MNYGEETLRNDKSEEGHKIVIKVEIQLYVTFILH